MNKKMLIPPPKHSNPIKNWRNQKKISTWLELEIGEWQLEILLVITAKFIILTIQQLLIVEVQLSL